jgi:hypothetical protein
MSSTINLFSTLTYITAFCLCFRITLLSVRILVRVLNIIYITFIWFITSIL